MAETASDTASSLQLIRTLINPNAQGGMEALAPIRGRSPPMVESHDDLTDAENMTDVGSDNDNQYTGTRSHVEFSTVIGSSSRYIAPSRASFFQESTVSPERNPPEPTERNPPEHREHREYREEPRAPRMSEAAPVLSEADVVRSKHTMLIELHYLKGQGAQLTKDYTIYDDEGDLHFELLRQRNLVDCTQTVDQWMVYIVVGIYLLEWGNSFLGSPLYFQGLGEYMQKNIGSIRVPLQRCYHRYVHRPSNSPIWDVVKALVFSLVAYHLQMMLVTSVAGASSARNTNVAPPSNIMSMLPLLMNVFGGSSGFGNMFNSAGAAPAPSSHVPFGAGVKEELRMPPPPPFK